VTKGDAGRTPWLSSYAGPPEYIERLACSKTLSGTREFRHLPGHRFISQLITSARIAKAMHFVGEIEVKAPDKRLCGKKKRETLWLVVFLKCVETNC
jgi:hypothetical protein